MKKIIALWTHPRSLSTAFCMLMKQRTDFNVLIEPFKFMYYEQFYKNDPEIEKDYFEKKVFAAYQENRQNIHHLSEIENVFFKDMAYFVIDDIKESELKEYINVFLIRSPKKALPSYHFAMKRYGIEKIELKEYGYKELYELYCQCRQFSEPLVINADDLENNTVNTIRKFEAHAGLKPCDKFTWDEADNPLFHNQSSRFWHENTAKTHSIVKLNSVYETNIDNNSRLKEVYDYCKPFHDKLLKRCS